jgi:hypothetical protein
LFDKALTTDRRPDLHSPFASGRLTNGSYKHDDNGDDWCCPAFGCLRGTHDRALALQLRFHDGNSDWFSYSLLASWRYNPSAGLLLKFAGDVVSLVLVCGSNLASAGGEDETSLTDGLQAHRVTWIAELDKAVGQGAAETDPTVDRILVGEFESSEEATGWLRTVAPLFLRT